MVTLVHASALSKEDHKLTSIINDFEAFYLTSSPFHNAERFGNNKKLPNLSATKLSADYQQRLVLVNKLLSINVQSLTLENQINRSVLLYSLQNKIDEYRFKAHYTPFTAESGFHVDISSIASKIDFKTVADYEDYLSRLAKLPYYFSQQIGWMKKGLAEGYSQPKIVLNGFEKSIAAFIKADVTKSVYYEPFTNFSDFIESKQQKILQKKAKESLTNLVMPAYQAYYDFMVNEYLPHARKDIAATSLPNGQAFYQNRVKHYTTLDMSAEEIHQQGIEEVERIRAEMDEIIKTLQFKGSFSEFIEFLRTEPSFYAKTASELLKEASFVAKKMDAKLPSLFKTLPRSPYGVMAVPANIAPKYTTGRYSGSTRDDQPGNYWVNTYRLDRRPLYVLPALTLHEAVPGHHLQISLAKEMTNVAQFRNRTYISAFGEGWGLYAEYLGVEAGIYETPYHNFGRLTYEMWRACRLVVDTGMHTQGWSRAKAVAFLADNTALSVHNVNTEIDRYISWPGQALSYKMGELTIKSLRKKAESRLGNSFDLREFHDQLLKHGSMPLPMLEQVITDYINVELAEAGAD
jgi:uncharacterized protein (DUF885 family)